MRTARAMLIVRHPGKYFTWEPENEWFFDGEFCLPVFQGLTVQVEASKASLNRRSPGSWRFQHLQAVYFVDVRTG